MEKSKKTRNPLSLKVKLLLIIIPIIFIYTWTITAINSNYILRGTTDTLETALSETAQISAEHISESISSRKELTTLLASRIGLLYAPQILMPYSVLDVPSFEERISRIGQEYGFLHMMVANLDGFTRTENHTDLATQNVDYYTEIVDNGAEVFVSDVTMDKGKLKGHYVINYSAPIHNENGEMIAVLICKADAAELSALVTDISVGEGGSTFITDDNGQCIAHHDPEMLFYGKKYSEYKNNPSYSTLNTLWDTMAKKDQGYMSYDFNGRHYAAFSRIKGTNKWSIAVSVSEDEFMAGAIASRNMATWLGLAMIVLFSLIMILIFRYSMKGIRSLSIRLESLADGNLSTDIVIDRSFDETFRLSQAAAKFVVLIQTLVHETEYLLGEIAQGNLTVTPVAEYPGNFSELKTAIETNLRKLTEIMQRISRTSEEVARGSAQMASGASGLAQGASEQASSLAELFETVTSLAQRTYEIGGVDRKKLADIESTEYNSEDEDEAAKHRIEAAHTMSEKLTIAIARIAEASSDIRRIASNIDSISSETGMLALNASVEATHAGEAGRGFSVIASEIRNLSEKSRTAAKDADDKITSISRAVNRGTQIVDITVSTIGEMTIAMEQVKGALEQISSIVESIAATAQETAAGSEELSAQAGLLKNLVSEFKYLDCGESQIL